MTYYIHSQILFFNRQYFFPILSPKIVAVELITFLIKHCIMDTSNGGNMKINNQTLMSTIVQEEKRLDYLMASLRTHLFSITIEEMDGKKNIVEDYKNEFKEEQMELENLINNLCCHKKILFNNNNTFKLKDGRTIQQAISDNNYLRKVKSFYESIVRSRITKHRVTEAHNSYFECHEINFDPNVIKEKIISLDNQIIKTDYEISKLNSLDFEI